MDDILIPSKRRKRPITSYGIILYCIHRKLKEPIFFVCKRRDTFAYIEFIKGNINDEDIEKAINNMTNEERKRILSHQFYELWKDLWVEEDSKICIYEYKNAVYRYKILFSKAKELLESCCNVKDTEWEFPKGRKHVSETELQCALREFEEETGINRKYIKVKEDIPRYEELYIGTDGKEYKSVYYVAQCSYPIFIEKKRYKHIIRSYTLSSEFIDYGWYNVEQTKERINSCKRMIVSSVFDTLMSNNKSH